VGKRRAVPGVGTTNRTVQLTITADDFTLEKLAALLLFSTLPPKVIELPDMTPDEEVIDEVKPEEVEDVRGRVRELLHEYAERHGLTLAKALLADCGTEGVGKADAQSLARLRHELTKGGPDGNGKNGKGRGQDRVGNDAG